MSSDRYSRQSGMIDMQHLSNLSCAVVGCGAIGRNVALQLASIGVQRLTLVDFDVVEETNVVTQGFLESQIGMSKVKALRDSCLAINQEMIITIREQRFSPKIDLTGAVLFVCVDSIETRLQIWNQTRFSISVFIDGRMSAETMRIIMIDNPSVDDYYPSVCFPESEGYQGACTARSTIYCANIAAGMLVSTFSKWLRQFKVEKDFMLNLLSNELIIIQGLP